VNLVISSNKWGLCCFNSEGTNILESSDVKRVLKKTFEPGAIISNIRNVIITIIINVMVVINVFGNNETVKS